MATTNALYLNLSTAATAALFGTVAEGDNPHVRVARHGRVLMVTTSDNVTNEGVVVNSTRKDANRRKVRLPSDLVKDRVGEVSLVQFRVRDWQTRARWARAFGKNETWLMVVPSNEVAADDTVVGTARVGS